MSLKNATLWSFLNQSSAKREIVCPDDLRVTIEAFADELKFQLKDNQLPAAAELTQVNWDDTGTTQKLILVRYTDTQASTNVLQYAVGLEQLGKFVYLEKRTFLDPPQLLPRIEGKARIAYTKKQDEDDDIIDTTLGCAVDFITGVVGGITGLIALALFSFDLTGAGLIFLLTALVMFGFILSNMSKKNEKRENAINENKKIQQRNEGIRKKNNEIDRWNEKKDARDREWQEIFDRWHSEVLEVAYLATTTDVFGRWTSAVSTTIDQVVQKLFLDHQAQAQQWDEEKKSKEQLEQALHERLRDIF